MSELHAGTSLNRGDFTIDGASLGAGGQATVYPALAADLADRVAAKVFFDTPANTGMAQAEGQIGARLPEHRNIIRTIDFGRMPVHAREGIALGDREVIITELAAGGSFADYLARTAPAERQVGKVVDVIGQASTGLAFAHELDTVHYDIKPQNLLLDQNGTVKVADFGIARPAPTDTHNPTTAKGFAGTPAFAAPEQLVTLKAGRRADGFALAVTTYLALAGKYPFRPKEPGLPASWAALYAKNPAPLGWDQAGTFTATDIHDQLWPVVAKQLSANKDVRYSNIGEYGAALLEGYQKGRDLQTKHRITFDLRQPGKAATNAAPEVVAQQRSVPEARLRRSKWRAEAAALALALAVFVGYGGSAAAEYHKTNSLEHLAESKKGVAGKLFDQLIFSSDVHKNEDSYKYIADVGQALSGYMPDYAEKVGTQLIQHGRYVEGARVALRLASDNPDRAVGLLHQLDTIWASFPKTEHTKSAVLEKQVANVAAAVAVKRPDVAATFGTARQYPGQKSTVIAPALPSTHAKLVRAVASGDTAAITHMAKQYAGAGNTQGVEALAPALAVHAPQALAEIAKVLDTSTDDLNKFGNILQVYRHLAAVNPDAVDKLIAYHISTYKTLDPKVGLPGNAMPPHIEPSREKFVLARITCAPELDHSNDPSVYISGKNHAPPDDEAILSAMVAASRHPEQGKEMLKRISQETLAKRRGENREIVDWLSFAVQDPSPQGTERIVKRHGTFDSDMRTRSVALVTGLGIGPTFEWPLFG